MEYNALDISITDEKSFKEYKVPSLRNYKKFDFNSSKSNEKYKITNFQYFVRDLVKNNDTINGAKVHFSSNTDYETFVSVIDILNVEKIPTWAFYKNDFWVFVRPASKPLKQNSNISYNTCGYYEANKEYWLKMEQEAEREKQYSLFKKYWVLFLGYFGIVLLNIFALIKFNKRKIIN